MNLTLVMDAAAFKAAIASTDKLGSADIQKGLNAPLDGVLLGRVEEAWEAVRNALDRAFIHGVESVQSLVESTSAKVDQLLLEAGRRADDVAIALREKIRHYLEALVDQLLKQMKQSIKVGEKELHVNAVSMSQKIVIGGSLKASLTDAISMTSSGEITVNVNYSA